MQLVGVDDVYGIMEQEKLVLLPRNLHFTVWQTQQHKPSISIERRTKELWNQHVRARMCEGCCHVVVTKGS
ncbi:uncharacterized protein DS421_4g110000 [Arachis hypogaea]|nr:uncharacterized protein DS421_4g110000 [Arachis hypogaea]